MDATVKRAKMTAMPDTHQTIARFTPLADVLAAIDAAAKPVAACEVEVAAARGRVLATDVAAARALPPTAIALQDGWAVSADATRDAGGYAPAILPQAPVRIEAGQPMPNGTDAVAPFETIQMRGGQAETVAAVAAGEGVLAAGSDCAAGKVLRAAGQRVRGSDAAVFAATGATSVSVRMPRVSIVPARKDPILDAAANFIATDVARQGGDAQIAAGDLDRALRDEGADALVVVGGTGSGRNDKSVQALARAGRVAVHGVALIPGETAAFGTSGSRPVLLIPGRLGAAFAVWLTVGRHMLARLSGWNDKEQSTQATLSRKITSTVSLTEFVPVRRAGDSVEPLAMKYLSLSALAQADGFVLVPAGSEGFQAGSVVSVRPWP